MKWLHLSDLHYNPERDGRNTGQLRKELLTFLKDKKFSVDEIFITGDFRHALHQKDELSSLAKDVVSYIMEVAKCVGITSSKKIHILPGNHDLIFFILYVRNFMGMILFIIGFVQNYIRIF